MLASKVMHGEIDECDNAYWYNEKDSTTPEQRYCFYSHWDIMLVDIADGTFKKSKSALIERI